MQEQLLWFAEIGVGLAGLASGVQEERKRRNVVINFTSIQSLDA